MPTLSSEVKACSVKPVIFFLQHELCECRVHFEEKKLIEVASYSICSLLRLCDNEPLVMSATAAETGYQHGRLFLRCYGALAQRARDRNVERWHLRPKAHYFDESLMCMRSTRENPARQSNTLEECFMGKMKRIACKVHRSTQAVRTVMRYVLFLKFRWHELSRQKVDSEA